MKYFLLLAMAISLTFGTINSQYAWADETTETTESDTDVSTADRPLAESTIQKKYSLTDEQMKTLKDAGLNTPQMAKLNQLALKSGKPLEDVLKMRTEQKMGWGKISKELGVHPSEIGKAVSSLRHEMNSQRKEAKSEKRATKMAAKSERRQARQEKRIVKHEKRMERRAAHRGNRKK